MGNAILAILLFFSMNVANAKSVDCSDIEQVAKEAVAYSLLAAWEPFATHSCFKNEKFFYFKPELAEPEGEVTDSSQFIWFDKKTDSYEIKRIVSQKDTYRIEVEFKIANKTFMTTYIYDPQPTYFKKTGVCGYVVNNQHAIFRRDCLDPESGLKVK